jgi:class 3 adenylate cyclase
VPDDLARVEEEEPRILRDQLRSFIVEREGARSRMFLVRVRTASLRSRLRYTLRLVGCLPPAHAGIAVGPVIFQDGDYYGRTVNLASRLAGLAEPGQTLVDAEVVRLVGVRDDIDFRGLGDVPVKGMTSPVQVFEAALR